ncbi:DUF4328 domain-containing protein [Luteolibacter ambystomatis]|uniref:DUF4328 domain-containing protein n=1 Tax=Luteolibacter ambystomatis TaxID=2824561 RepID=A0A975J025_9BACT|nr:DUF4328 domain-containing protein [Luteolibacter ambystomatis]QUE51405.1 DUF4328 domain-containing protein [Luteolibacter ambystomatis]
MAELPDNPYAAPATTDAPTGAILRADGQELQDPRTLGWLAVGFLWLYAFCRIVFGWMEAGMSGLYMEDAAQSELPAVGTGLTFIGTVITFLMWTYRCSSNAWRLERMDTKPGMAVGSYFIPFYNLAGPCLAMREIIQVTYRHTDRKSIKGLVMHWWLGWVTFNLSSRFMQDSEYWWFPLACMTISAAFLTAIILNLGAAQSTIRAPLHLPDDGHSRLRHSPLPAIEAGLPLANLPRHKSHDAPVPEPKKKAAPSKPHPNAPVPRRPEAEGETPPP